jgi:hypothetical protein
MNGKPQIRNYATMSQATITGGAGAAFSHFVEGLFNLHTTIEGIASADGQKTKVKSIRLTVRAWSRNTFHTMPVIVQTAGTITDTVDLETYFIQDVNLDQVIDDVFGYQNLFPNIKTSRRVPTTNPTADTGYITASEYSVEIPGNILQILNKETETERLQNLHLVLYGGMHADNQVIILNKRIDIKFINTRKTIILR